MYWGTMKMITWTGAHENHREDLRQVVVEMERQTAAMKSAEV
jgi:hypothetical protein